MRLAGMLVLVACAPQAPQHARMGWSASGVDWSKPPAAVHVPLAPPVIEAFTLPNGLRVLLAPAGELPVVSVTTLHFAAGSRDDPPRQAGLAAMTIDTLSENPQLAAGLDNVGARLDLSIATDYATARMTALSDRFEGSIELLASVLVRPQLDDDIVERLRNQHLLELAQQRERPRTLAAQLFDRIVFGAHAYAHPAAGIATEVSGLSAVEVRAFYAQAYGPTTTTILIAGPVSRERVEKALEHAFGAWATPQPLTISPAPRTPAPRQIAYLDLPGASETSIVIGQLAPPGGEEHQLAADVANAVLGGVASSRLDRELHGIAIGAGSSFWRGQLAGTWTVATTVPAASTADALRRALAVIDKAHTDDLPAAELSRAKAAVLDASASLFETTNGTARALQRLATQNLTRDYYATLEARLAALTAADVRTAMTWRDLVIVVAGDWRTIGESVRALGTPVAHYDLDGKRLP